ncbi:MAG TPA: prepilin-type N-terminal cleavage/methylation domain-containing protein [Syntrophomonadaceae bacterium]|nr:prepilin-type N-terminal cleavage/methylation domain-containing protein [Syntrophomonadaceae bacterium]
MEYFYNQKGMTLVEVLVALVLLTLLSVSLLSVVTTSSVWVFKAGKSTKAMTLASSIMEDIKANSFVLTKAEGLYLDNVLHLDVNDGGLGLCADYMRNKNWADIIPEVTIRPFSCDDTLTDNLIKVTVKVSWQEKGYEYCDEIISIVSRR